MAIGAGCGKSVAEKAIESATNGQAKVDLGTNTVKVNNNGSTWEVGDQVKLPTGFPSDIYVIAGTIKSAITSVEGKSYSISIESTKTVTQANDAYTTDLKANGWTIGTTANINGAVMLAATKGTRNVTITMGAENGKTVITLVTSDSNTNS